MKLYDAGVAVICAIFFVVFAWFLWLVFSKPAEPNKVHTPYIQRELRR